jgi:hypothetical protein
MLADNINLMSLYRTNRFKAYYRRHLSSFQWL